jgi:hypothetical protein
MIALLGLLFVGIGSIIAGVVLAIRRKRKWAVFLFSGLGICCLAAVAIMILALSHFGEVPRD